MTPGPAPEREEQGDPAFINWVTRSKDADGRAPGALGAESRATAPPFYEQGVRGGRGLLEASGGDQSCAAPHQLCAQEEGRCCPVVTPLHL